MQRRRSFRDALTLAEHIVLLLIVLTLCAILFPVFAQQRGSSRRSCLSNVKQIAVGMMMYLQDNDETYPPVYSLQTTENGPLLRAWGGDYAMPGENGSITVPGLLAPYTRNPMLFRCPTVVTATRRKDLPTTYLYSDLAATVRLNHFTAPAKTVLLTDSEPRLHNFGHARAASGTPAEPLVLPETKIMRTEGGEVGDALTRHGGGANYAFADGHVKHLKPDAVYFPPRDNGSRSHRENGVSAGPDPAGDRTFAGHLYHATFHIK
jgi:prepilin-type processing-associated H-X9-DG protein